MASRHWTCRRRTRTVGRSGWDDSQRLEIGSPQHALPEEPRLPDHQDLLSSNQPGAGLLDSLQEWRDADWSSTSECHVPERRAIDANRAAVERAKGALMQRYGVDRVQAFSLMVRWARLTHTPVHTLARTLVQRIDDPDPQPIWRHRPLIRWLEVQLRHADP